MTNLAHLPDTTEKDLDAWFERRFDEDRKSVV
jgi:hypothetical protein